MSGRRFLSLVAAFFMASLLSSGQIARQVKVIVENANIRVKPGLDAEVLDIVTKDTVLEVIEKTGPWYTVKWDVDKDGKSVQGYIHESVVEPVGETAVRPRVDERPKEPESPPPPPPPAVREKRPLPAPEVEARPKPPSREKLISGSFVKFGWGDHWLASFGTDIGLARNFGIGLELQPYYTSVSVNDLHILRMDVFVNAKLGLKLGLLSLFGGGGIGPDLYYSTREIEGETFSEFKTMLAQHVLAGVELDLKFIGLIFEYQMIMVSDPNADPDTWSQFFLLGLKF